MFNLRISFKQPLYSIVADHGGSCLFTWRNKNQIDNRLDQGVTGDFRNVETTVIPYVWKMTGEEFHGIVKDWRPDTVQSTGGITG